MVDKFGIAEELEDVVELGHRIGDRLFVDHFGQMVNKI